MLVICRGSSEESTKASLPNLTNLTTSASGIQIHIARAVSKEENINNILHDIEESPTSSASGFSELTSTRPKSLLKELNPPKIEYSTVAADAIESTEKTVTEKRQNRVKTPKSYFLESFQKRKKCAKEAISTAAPNAFRNRKSNQNSAEEIDEEIEFCDLEKIPVDGEDTVEKNDKKKFWPTPNIKSHKYVVQHPPKALQWSSNLQHNYQRKP